MVILGKKTKSKYSLLSYLEQILILACPPKMLLSGLKVVLNRSISNYLKFQFSFTKTLILLNAKTLAVFNGKIWNEK